MKLAWYILLAVPAIAQQSEFATGRACYGAGEFKTAVSHFQLALKQDPKDAASNYWMGRSYETLADISTPFGGKYHALARTYLTKALELAPNRPEYRQELFSFLLDSGEFSRSEQRQAAIILLAGAESDPDYDFMRARFEQARQVNASFNAWISRLFLSAPQAAMSLLPAR
jgi:tetratricopeptide (TPR) repeat protein